MVFNFEPAVVSRSLRAIMLLCNWGHDNRRSEIMIKLFLCLSVALIALAPTDARSDFTGKGHVHTLSETQQVFLNPDCRASDTCDLKRFTLIHLAHEIWFSDDPKHPTHASGAIMEYETDSVAAIEKYAVVQFVKGCVFTSARNRDGEITRDINYGVSSFGETIPLCFPDWVIDSQDTDPVYNSDPEHGRFHLLRWNRAGSHDLRTETYYGEEKPKTPVVYLTDYPAGAFVTATGVKNTALSFRTCIYKAAEVPRQTLRDHINFARPLGCFEWQNVYVYDFDEGRFLRDWNGLPAVQAPVARVDRLPLIIFALGFAILVAFVFSRFRRLPSWKNYNV